jgi:hypothetical protein
VSRLLKTPATAGVLFWGSALLAGCVTPQVAALLERPDPLLPERTELAATPFFPQELYQCGPAALATALARAGVKTSPEVLSPRHPRPSRSRRRLEQPRPGLLELNRGSEARAAAERAVALGGPRLAKYQATLKVITDPP